MHGTLPLLPGMRRPLFASSGTNPGTANCRAWWKLDDASGSFVDAKGINTLDTIGGTPTYEVAAKVGNGMTLDGVNEYARKVVSNPITAGVYPFSASGWVKIPAAETTGTIWGISQTTTNIRYWTVALVAGKLVMQSRNTTVRTVTSSASINTDAWVHVAAVWASDTERRLYINGAADGGGAAETSVSHGILTGSVHIGAHIIFSGVSDYLNATLDEWTAWNIALSLSNVEWLYNSGTGRAFTEL